MPLATVVVDTPSVTPPVSAAGLPEMPAAAPEPPSVTFHGPPKPPLTIVLFVLGRLFSAAWIWPAEALNGNGAVS